MADEVVLPSYQELFDEVPRTTDESRSVYSPAAYLADLLQLVDDHFEDALITRNRPGIAEIPLDPSHTDSEVPYLDVVNDVLARRLSDQLHEDAFTAMSGTSWPFALPFDREHVRRHMLLRRAGVSAEQLYRRFTPAPDPDTTAMELLAIAPSFHSSVTTGAVDEAVAATAYGFVSGTVAGLADAAQLCERAGLTSAQLRELLFQDLSETATDVAGTSERALAATFFVNQGEPPVTLSPDGSRLLKAGGPVPWQWFERAGRFVRLARLVELPFADLDLVLRTCCGNVLDAAAVRTLATVLHLRDVTGLAVDVVCALVAPLSTSGIGDADLPADLFNRTFNTALIDADPAIVPGGPFLPAGYAERPILTCHGDLIDPRNAAFCRRIARGAGLSIADVDAVVTRFRAEVVDLPAGGPFEGEIGVAALSLLYRVGTLMRVLDMGVADLFGVLDVLRRDQSVRTGNPFDLLFDAGATETDPYRILAEPRPAEALWLVQLLVSVGGWLADADIAGAELARMLDVADPGTAASTVPTVALAGLREPFGNVLLVPETFVSERFSARDAAVVHRAVIAAGGVVSPHDARLVRDPDGAAERAAAYAALAELPGITRDDFRGLGITGRLRDKIVANLTFRGFLRADGTLVEELFPDRGSDFRLAGSFGEVRDELFEVMMQLRLVDAEDADPDAETVDRTGPVDEDATAPAPDAADAPEVGDSADPGTDEGAVDDGAVEPADTVLTAPTDPADPADELRTVSPHRLDPARFFPSDLRLVAALDPADDAELYDNLVYLRYIDADGNLLEPELFEDEESVEWFDPDVDLGLAGPAVWALIRDRLARFSTDQLVLDPAVFADLPLDDVATERLLADLRFTGHIDEAGAYTDKVALLALGRDRIELALEFYPLRRAVLEAMQDQIAAFRAHYVTFPPEAFDEIADAALALVVDERLTDRGAVVFTPAGKRIENDLAAALAGPTASIELLIGAEFGPADEAAVVRRLAAIRANAQRYRLDLTELGFGTDEAAVLVDLLVGRGDLTADLMVPAGRIPEFLDVRGALTFAVDGFADDASDIFFLLHAMAIETAAATTEITAALERIAAAQRLALTTGLSDLFGVTPDVVEAMCTAICGSTASAIDTLVAPVLAPTGAAASDPATGPLWRRLATFGAVAARLALTGTMTEIVFRDRGLAGKFPERLVLPPGVTTIDALVPGDGGTVALVVGAAYWTYAVATGALTTPGPTPLTTLSPRFAALAGVDAAFADGTGRRWLVGHDASGAPRTFVREAGSATWTPSTRAWGVIRNDFADPTHVDTAFRDRAGTTYLFCGDQYVRYSGRDYAAVDEGYPRLVEGNWELEGLGGLTAEFADGVDASFQGRDGVTYLFASGRYVPAPAGGGSAPVNGRWGILRNALAGAPRVDAAFTRGGRHFLLRDDQLVRYTDDLGTAGVTVDEGYPRRIETEFPQLPVEFESGVQAAFTDAAGSVHLFKNGRTVVIDPDGPAGAVAVTPVAERWGLLGAVLPSGTVDAAFVGLDGRTYLFSGERYVRYSGSDYSRVDPGYPRAIAPDWGGMRTVTASFVLDGRTYLFGAAAELLRLAVAGGGAWAEFAARLDAGEVPAVLRDALAAHDLTPVPAAAVTGTGPQWLLHTEGGMAFTVRRDDPTATVTVTAAGIGNGGLPDEHCYVRYSTADYRTPDAGHPRPLALADWWQLPDSLDRGGSPFSLVDAVFTGADGMTYLFAGEQFVRYDNRERWWSTPQPIATAWDSLPFERVDAAFVGTDGRTYVFSGPRYVRYSGPEHSRLDDRYPADIALFWGVVENHIARTGVVDAVAVVETVTPEGMEQRHTYLFSGDQYVRYSDATAEVVDDGYPRLIAGSLAAEPGFGNVEWTAGAPIDAVLADHRSVTVFSGRTCHVRATALHKTYPAALPATPLCVFVEDGSLLVEDASGWHRTGAIEVAPGDPAGHIREPVRPRTLRGVPERYRTGLSAVLAGTDGNVYLFRGSSCFDVALGRDYPVVQDWGRVRNTVADAGVVDAGFVGLDGRTYVFGGDQFVVYAGSGYPDADIVGQPACIAEHWAGLSRVAIAFVEGERTFLCEPAGPDGRFRYAVYHGSEYRRPEPGSPRTAGPEFWDAPEQARAAGFGPVTAVLVERGNRFLISGTEYLERTAAGVWSRRHPVRRLLPGLPFGDADTPVESAFSGADGATWVFSRGRFSRHDGEVADLPQPTLGRWGRFSTAMASPNRATAVDAAFVDHGITYLFSGAEYVRYSSADYRWVDSGYPRPVVELRHEECFANLPDAVELLLAERVAAGAETVVDAVVAGERAVTLFIGADAHVVARGAEAAYDLGLLGQVRNTLAATGRVDAAFTAGEHTYLFSGDQYVRYTGDRYALVDEGYPRTIDSGLPSEIGVEALPAPFGDGVDAALDGADGRIYLFTGRRFVANDAPNPTPRPIPEVWGRVDSRFAPGRLDAAFVAATGELYAFAGDQYVRYADPAAPVADDGYPRSIKDDWGDLPVAYEDGIDAAFRFDGRTYLVRGSEYVRWSGAGFLHIDRPFPQPLTALWGPWVDYTLADLRAISRFARLAAAHPDPDGGIAGALTGAGRVEDPYVRLAAAFGWDVAELAWAVRHAGFLPAHTDLDLLFRLVDEFATAAALGATPETVYEQVWRPLYDAAGGTTPASAGDALHRMVLDRASERDRTELERRLHRELAEAVRDALVATVVANTEGVHGPDDLFDLLLLDVRMGGQGTTSAVREAIGATQLFFQRYFLGLVPTTVRAVAGRPDAVKAELRRWWAWMKNYRVWEDNRRVYLYPENYLRPELRKTRTAAFDALQGDLLQGELTADAVRRAYAAYLDEYTEVSRLTIAGGFVAEVPGGDPADPDDPAWDLVLFGRTKTDPRRYYFRRAAFAAAANRSAVWDPWSKVDVRIDADRVYPVVAFERVFVFWTALDKEAGTEPSSTFSDQGDGSQHTYSRETDNTYTVRVYFSFYDLNGRWTPAQQLMMDPLVVEKLAVSDISLLVETATAETIVVRCAYRVTDPVTQVWTPRTVAYSLSAELFTKPAPVETFEDAGPGLFQAIFAEPVAPNPFEPVEAEMIARHDAVGGQMLVAIRRAEAELAKNLPIPSVVMFNHPRASDTAPWFAFDHKGGSFLCKPAPLPPGTTLTPEDLPLHQPDTGARDRLPALDHVDAAFTAPDGTDYFFDAGGHRYVAIDRAGAARPAVPIADRWGRTQSGFAEAGAVDAVLSVGDRLIVVAGSTYARFSGSLAIPDDGYPRPLRSNIDGLPRWTGVTAAFTGLDGHTYFFQGGQYADLAAPNRRLPVAQKWGRVVQGVRAGTGIFDTGEVTAAAVVGNHTFLVAGDRYVRYTGGSYEFVDAGYPRDVAGNPDGLPGTAAELALDHAGAHYVFDLAARSYTVARPGEPPVRRATADLGGGGALGNPPVVTAACIVGGHLYLVADSSFVRYTIGADGTLPTYVDPGYPKPCSVPVDALLAAGGALVVFSRDTYCVLPVGQELDAPMTVRPISGNWAGLPHDFRGGIDRVLDTSDALYLLRGDQYVRYGRTTHDGSPPLVPHEQAGGRFEIVRLTTGTAATLNQRMFTGGVAAVLDVETQETDERPSFATDTSSDSVIRVRPEKVAGTVLPVATHLDFDSANGLYYWEIFFHAPMLIADALAAAQRFEDAIMWLEFVFDPTHSRDPWRFLPFRETDVNALVTSVAEDLKTLGGTDTVIGPLLPVLHTLAPVFAQERDVAGTAEAETLDTVPAAVAKAITAIPRPGGDPALAAWQRLQETGPLIGLLARRYELMTGGRAAALRRYLDDPFDAHAIAALRTGAYRRSVVMAYLDTLLDWADSLFRQYTGESIDQARMLYILAADLLGPRPDDLGTRKLRDARTFGHLTQKVGEYDYLLRRAAAPPRTGAGVLVEAAAVHSSIATADPDDPHGDSYFTIPENEHLTGYWDRVDDRLRKIRASEDILGVARPVPLFDPPLDTAALVGAAGSPGGLAAASMAPVAAPHYRFSSMLARAQELTDRVAQFGADLLLALEKRDGEAMTVLQTAQEGVVLGMTTAIREAAIGSATATVAELAAGRAAAEGRRVHYQGLLDGGPLPTEIAQAELVLSGVEANVAASVLKLAAGIAHVFPQFKLGLFNFGTELGGQQIGASINMFADFSQTLGGAFSATAELLGLLATRQRTLQDWQLQLDIATHDVVQISAQQDGAAQQLLSAQRDLEILQKEIDNNAAVARFLTGKFGTVQLYQWMAEQLSALYFRAYGMAHDLARQAERAYQFECGVPESTIITPAAWDGRHNGMLAGARLGLDLQALAAAYRDANQRGLEITRTISLAELDPVALLGLRSLGTCEFTFPEALFARDFPGQYRRQIRTLSVTMVGADGQAFAANAMLTQIQHKTVLLPDLKAVSYLLDGKGGPTDAIRNDWRPSQRIALSHVGDGQENNGLFELRYDDERFLPFEGTGAVSTWRLELVSRGADYQPGQVQDVVVTLRYTAEQGDAEFTAAVTGMLKPFPAYRYLDVPETFPDEWQAFLDGDSDVLTIGITPDLFPGMRTRQITAVTAALSSADSSPPTLTLNANPAWTLHSGIPVITAGLSIGTRGSNWTLTVQSGHAKPTGIALVLTYPAGVR